MTENKLKIGNTEFTLNSWSENNYDNNSRPQEIFDLQASYAEVKPLIIKNQTYIIESIIDEEISTRDVSFECNMFYSLLDKDNTCVLTMEDYSNSELVSLLVAPTVNIHAYKCAYKRSKLSQEQLQLLVLKGILTQAQYEEIVGE